VVLTVAVGGGGSTDRYVILGGHRDAWVFGGIDPMSGVAVVHETVRSAGKLLSNGVCVSLSLSHSLTLSVSVSLSVCVCGSLQGQWELVLWLVCDGLVKALNGWKILQLFVSCGV